MKLFLIYIFNRIFNRKDFFYIRCSEEQFKSLFDLQVIKFEPIGIYVPGKLGKDYLNFEGFPVTLKSVTGYKFLYDVSDLENNYGDWLSRIKKERGKN